MSMLFFPLLNNTEYFIINTTYRSITKKKKSNKINITVFMHLESAIYMV